MTPMEYERNRAALLKEREKRAAAYATAVAERDTLPADADHGWRRNVEARVTLALDEMKRWSDPIPAAEVAVTFIAPDALPPVERSGAVSQALSEADKLANEIIAAAEGVAATIPSAKTAAERLADEIVASAELAAAADDQASNWGAAV